MIEDAGARLQAILAEACGEFVGVKSEEVPVESFFDRFAGYFHAFGLLETEVLGHLDAGRDGAACYRLFGRKYDSLGTLLDRVLDQNDITDDVDRYVVCLCARQLLDRVKAEHAEYWAKHENEAIALTLSLARSMEVRERLATKEPDKMSGFLDWFDGHFLPRSVAWRPAK